MSSKEYIRSPTRTDIKKTESVTYVNVLSAAFSQLSKEEDL